MSKSQIFTMANMSFNVICENNILSKILEFTVKYTNQVYILRYFILFKGLGEQFKIFSMVFCGNFQLFYVKLLFL